MPTMCWRVGHKSQNEYSSYGHSVMMEHRLGKKRGPRKVKVRQDRSSPSSQRARQAPLAGLNLQNRTAEGLLGVGSPCASGSTGLHTSMPTGSTGLPHQGSRAPAPADHGSSPMWTWPWNLPPSLDVGPFRATLDEPMPWRAPTGPPPHLQRATWKGRVIKSL